MATHAVLHLVLRLLPADKRHLEWVATVLKRPLPKFDSTSGGVVKWNGTPWQFIGPDALVVKTYTEVPTSGHINVIMPDSIETMQALAETFCDDWEDWMEKSKVRSCIERPSKRARGDADDATPAPTPDGGSHRDLTCQAVVYIADVDKISVMLSVVP